MTADNTNESRDIVVQRAPRQIIQVEDAIPMLDTARFEHMQRVATIMAKASTLPSHILGRNPDETLGNCFLIINQATRWGMDPFAVAQSTFFVHGKMGYEGKLIAAMIEAKTEAPLDYEWFGDPGTDGYGIKVTGRRPADGKTVTIDGTVGDWKTFEKDGTTVKTLWRGKAQRNQLAYRGAREWARLYAPALMLGVYTADEMEGLDEDYRSRRAVNITPRDEASAPVPTDEDASAKPGNKYQRDAEDAEVETDTVDDPEKGAPDPDDKKADEPKKKAAEKEDVKAKAEKKDDKAAKRTSDFVPSGLFAAYAKKLRTYLDKATSTDELKVLWNGREKFAGPSQEENEFMIALLAEYRKHVSDMETKRAAANKETEETAPDPGDAGSEEDAPNPDDDGDVFPGDLPSKTQETPPLETAENFDRAEFLAFVTEEIGKCVTADQVASFIEENVNNRVDAGVIDEDMKLLDIMPLVDSALARIDGFSS